MSILNDLFGSASAPPGEIGRGYSNAMSDVSMARGGAPQTEGSTFSERLMNPLSQVGLALLANHGTPKSQRGMFEGVPQAVAGAVNYQQAKKQEAKAEEQKNSTLAWLEQNDPEVAGLVRAGMDLGDAYTLSLKRKQMAQGPEPTSEMRNFQFAQANPGFAEFVSPKDANAAARLSTQPVWGTNANGEPVLGQLSNEGRFVPSVMPDGVSAVSPADISEGRAYGGARGKSRAEAEGALPSAEGRAALLSGQIQSLKDDPYLPNMLGPWDSRTPDITEDAARVRAKMDQLQGGAFLEARQMLKGGGAITDFESQRAEAAFVRLNRAQSVEDYQKALDEFDTAVSDGLEKLQQGAGRATPAPVKVGDYVIEQVD